MSDSILSLLADELDVPPKQAKKLLIAMLREVKKRARREGVQLPEFGTFRESNGQITFEPSPSLARAVNHRFEGLQSEDLATAPDTEDEDDADDEGPSTITLGYQEEDWSPLDEEDEEAEQLDEQEDDEPDTEEFEVPAADEASETEEVEAPDTAEVNAPAAPSEPGDAGPAGAEEPAPEEAAEPDSSQTEELYPFVEDVPGGDQEEADATTEQRDAVDEEHDSLSGIWDSEEEADEDESDSFTFPDEDFALSSESETTAEPAPESEPASPPDPSAAPDAPTSEVEIDPEVRDATAEEKETASDEGGSSGVRVLAGVLVVLLLGGAGWYVLGQRGTVQPPRETFTQLSAQVQTQLNNLSTKDIPFVGPPSQESASATAEAESPPSSASETETSAADAPSSSSETQGDADAPSEPPTASSTTQTEPASSDQASSTGQTSTSRSINQAEGGWTVIVGSRTDRDAAQSLVEKYRATFTDRTLPVDVISGTVENTTRYRVGVGQFDSRTDAESFLETADQKLPQGAWPFRF